MEIFRYPFFWHAPAQGPLQVYVPNPLISSVGIICCSQTHPLCCLKMDWGRKIDQRALISPIKSFSLR